MDPATEPVLRIPHPTQGKLYVNCATTVAGGRDELRPGPDLMVLAADQG
jgi:hypothetical protein